MIHTVNIRKSDDGELVLDSSGTIARQIINSGAAQVEIRIVDPRNISIFQRKKARVIIGEIAQWSGHIAPDLHEYFKDQFCAMTDIEPFSLSDCDMTTARYYITYLIDFCVRHGVPTKKPLYAFCDDLEAYVYSCLCYRKCAVTGRNNADIHHCEGSRIGMGRNRKELVHKGLVCIPLSRELHNQIHTSGETDFFKKYHLCGIPLDEYLCNKLGLEAYAD